MIAKKKLVEEDDVMRHDVTRLPLNLASSPKLDEETEEAPVLVGGGV
jgi:hypothetical protein